MMNPAPMQPMRRSLRTGFGYVVARMSCSTMLCCSMGAFSPYTFCRFRVDAGCAAEDHGLQITIELVNEAAESAIHKKKNQLLCFIHIVPI